MAGAAVSRWWRDGHGRGSSESRGGRPELQKAARDDASLSGQQQSRQGAEGGARARAHASPARTTRALFCGHAKTSTCACAPSRAPSPNNPQGTRPTPHGTVARLFRSRSSAKREGACAGLLFCVRRRTIRQRPSKPCTQRGKKRRCTRPTPPPPGNTEGKFSATRSCNREVTTLVC